MDTQADSHPGRWSRAARVLAILLLVGSPLGLFGRGPLSAAHTDFPGMAADISYDRHIRRHAPSVMRLRLRIGPASVANDAGRVRLSIDNAYLRACHLESMMPEPVGVAVTSEGITWTFAVEAPPDLQEPLEITLRWKGERTGPVKGQLRLKAPGVSHSEIHIRQLIFP